MSPKFRWAEMIRPTHCQRLSSQIPQEPMNRWDHDRSFSNGRRDSLDRTSACITYSKDSSQLSLG
jgi:hypothetical protein